MEKLIVQFQTQGLQEMRTVLYEANHALNRRPGVTGIAPIVRLFGQNVKLKGELYSDGEEFVPHPDAANPGDELGKRFEIRKTARERSRRRDTRKRLSRKQQQRYHVR